MNVFVCMPTCDEVESLRGIKDDERCGVCGIDISFICLYDELIMFRHLYNIYIYL